MLEWLGNLLGAVSLMGLLGLAWWAGRRFQTLDDLAASMHGGGDSSASLRAVARRVTIMETQVEQICRELRRSERFRSRTYRELEVIGQRLAVLLDREHIKDPVVRTRAEREATGEEQDI